MSAVRGIDLSRYVERARATRPFLVEGRVRDVVGVIVGVEGLMAPVGAQLELDLGARTLRLEVLGFREGRLLTAPLGDTAGIAPGMRVRPREDGALAPVGDALLGHVVDAFGTPTDSELLGPTERAPVRCAPPPALSRRAITEPLGTGVRALDALLPLGLGQRVGLFAGTGVGKSTLLGMLCRHASADVIVVGLIGERGREVGDFVRQVLGRGRARALGGGGRDERRAAAGARPRRPLRHHPGGAFPRAGQARAAGDGLGHPLRHGAARGDAGRG